MEPERLARGGAVWALGVGQTLAYAAMFYIFAALILPWQAALGWDKATFALGPTLAIAISAALAPLAGRMVDRGRGPELLTGGAVLGALALVWLAQVGTLRGWLTGWAVIGVAQAACLYEVCFAFLIRRLGPAARAAIVRVTLVAGFASTLAFPAGAALAELVGWRGAVIAAAAVLVLVVAPMNHIAANAIRRRAPPPRPGAAEADRGSLRRALGHPGFWLLGLVFSLIGLNHWMIVSFLVPIFVQQGAATATAVLAASLVGPAQVLGRLVLMRFETRIGTIAAARFTLVGMLAAVALLWGTGLSPMLAFAYAITQGAAAGVMTILRPVMIAETLGQAGYGTIAGVIQIPPLLAMALAPLVGGLMLDGPGLGALIWLSLGLGLASVAAVVALGRFGR